MLTDTHPADRYYFAKLDREDALEIQVERDAAEVLETGSSDVGDEYITLEECISSVAGKLADALVADTTSYSDMCPLARKLYNLIDGEVRRQVSEATR